MKRHSIAASLTALITPLALSPAFAGPEYTSASGGTFTFYGNVNPAIVGFDDGVQSDTDIADSSKSSTKFGFWLKQPVGENEFRFQFETRLGFRPSSAISQTFLPDAWEWDKTNLRRIDFSYKTARYGTFYIGQGSLASDGAGSTDISGTGIISDVGIGDFVGSRFLRDSAGALTTVSMGSAFNNFDGARFGRVRYDSPSFNNFTVGFSYGKNVLNSSDKNRYYDVAINYSNKLPNGMTIAGGLGYLVANTDVGPNRKDLFGSVSALWDAGWNVTLTAGNRDPDGSFYMTKFGYIAKDWLPWGTTAVSVDYYRSSDMVSAGDNADSWGLAVVQKVDDYNLQVYFGYRGYSYEDNITTYRDANTYVAGVNWTF
ncbi:MAG TPA: porin [Albidovulum sp.]|uniref:porin n=1 Tax=Albidovulum sp. TaxID=1872424 RepID=UPI002BD15CC0|nr:porin [Albidovulum sp.]